MGFVVWRVFRKNEYGLFPKPDMRVEIDHDNGRVSGPRPTGGFEVILVRKKVVDLDRATNRAIPGD